MLTIPFYRAVRFWLIIEQGLDLTNAYPTNIYQCKRNTMFSFIDLRID